MKPYLLAFCLMLVPMCVHAQLSYCKAEMIWEADRHKKEAKAELDHAEKLCWYIPDIGSRDQMKVLIAATIASLPTKDPKTMLLSVGLALSGGLACNMYDKYCDLRTNLYTAAYHIEMANFYNQMSLNVSGQKKMDDGTKEFFVAIDNLTICEMLTDCIRDKWIRGIVSSYLTEKRKDLLQQFNKAGKLSYKIYKDALIFCENIYEAISEIEEDDVREDIGMYVYSALEGIAASLRHFEGYDCWPDNIFDNMSIQQLRCMMIYRSHRIAL
jgi:hypothetical protein